MVFLLCRFVLLLTFLLNTQYASINLLVLQGFTLWIWLKNVRRGCQISLVCLGWDWRLTLALKGKLLSTQDFSKKGSKHWFPADKICGLGNNAIAPPFLPVSHPSGGAQLKLIRWLSLAASPYQVACGWKNRRIAQHISADNNNNNKNISGFASVLGRGLRSLMLIGCFVLFGFYLLGLFYVM